MRSSQSANSDEGRTLSAGNDPTTPAWHCAITSSGTEEMNIGAAETGTERIELYTEGYASHYMANKESAIAPYISAAKKANELGLGINAGHDLDLNNLAWFAKNVPGLLEVSIGHALIADALYLGYENTIQLYKRQLK